MMTFSECSFLLKLLLARARACRGSSAFIAWRVSIRTCLESIFTLNLPGIQSQLSPSKENIHKDQLLLLSSLSSAWALALLDKKEREETINRVYWANVYLFLDFSDNASSETSRMGRGPSFFFYLLVFLAEILLFGVLILSLVWAQFYQGGFAWRDNVYKQFNLHPVLMITGFIFLMGHGNSLKMTQNKFLSFFSNKWLIDFFSQPCWFIAFLDAAINLDPRCSTRSCIWWPFLALSSPWLPFSTIITWGIRPFPICTRCTHGWDSLPLDFSEFK